MREKDDGKGRLGGRSKGKPNVKTAEMKIWIDKLINKNKKQLEADLLNMKPVERWSVVEKLMTYCLPKLQAVDAKIDIGRLSDTELDIVVNELLEKIEENEN